MNQMQTGYIIRELRKEKGYTQKQVAESIHVSDKAVSKWECGKGCPDISVLSLLAELFDTDIQILLSGRMDKNEKEKGNMKKVKFYVCKECGNIITSSSEAMLSCCGHKLNPLTARKAEPHEKLKVENLGDEWFITSDHEMTKEHYISFVAYVTDSSIMMTKSYPEWDLQVSYPICSFGRLIWYCDQCGLMYQDLPRSIK